MANIPSDQYWEQEFDITTADLDRIAERMRKNQIAYTLTDIVKRLIRGRLEHGEDQSPAALPDWVKAANILSWDEEEKWEIGSHILVARELATGLKPYLGVIIAASQEIFSIRLDEDGEVVKYGHVIPGSKQAFKRYEYVKNAIYEKELAAHIQQRSTRLEELVEVEMLKYGTMIAGRLLLALEHDNRFINLEDRWFCAEILSPIGDAQIRQLHQKMLMQKTSLPIFKMLPLLFPSLPNNDVSLFYLHHKMNTPSRYFGNEGTLTRPLWTAIKPPPPPPDKAIARYYVYDPETYQILIEPGQRLTHNLAQRLQTLELYAEVVELAP